MVYDDDFHRNMRETAWTKLFPHWWTTSGLTEIIGNEVERLKAEWIFNLLNAGIKPPVMLWKTDIDYEEYTIEKKITNEDNIIEVDAPLYKTHGILKIKNTSSDILSSIKIMLDDEDGILINDSIDINETLVIDTEKQQFHIEERSVKPTIYNNGFEYFKTSRNKKKFEDGTPLHNEILRLTFTSNSNIEADVEIVLKNVVFITEQNIEITSLEILPIEKVQLYAYYDFPFHKNVSGWVEVYEKVYDENTNVLADLITTQYYSQKYYVDVYFKAIQYPYRVGFPCYSTAEEKTTYHVNTHLDDWGELLGLPRRYYKKNIEEDDYPFTFPIFYPYDIEQDFWYYSRLINEYCWNEQAIDEIDLLDTSGQKIMKLHSIDPFVQDFVVHAKSIKPKEIEYNNFNKYQPIKVTQNNSNSIDYKEMSFINPENLLNQNTYEYTTLNLYQKAERYITYNLYQSKELDLMFDLSDLPENIIITGFEIKINGESTDNSYYKYNDHRSRFVLYNDNEEIYSNSIESTESFGLKNKTIIYGGSDEKFNLQDLYVINNEKINVRDILVKNGIHFILTFTNDNEKQSTTIIIRNIEFNIYYKPKGQSIELKTKIELDKDNNKKIGYLISSIKNVGEKPINTYVDFFSEKGIILSEESIPINLDINSEQTNIVDIYSDKKIINKKYQIATICENKVKYNDIYLTQTGQIETEVIIKPFYVTYNDDFNLKAEVFTFNKNFVTDGVVRFYINDFFVGEGKVEDGEVNINIYYKDIKSKLNSGLYSLEAKYMGNLIYQPSRKYTSILISKKPTQLEITSDEVAVTNKDYIFSAKVLNNNNTVNNGSVKFYLNDEEIGSGIVDENGEVSFPYRIIQKEGQYKLKATFNGSIDFGFCEVEKEISIIGGETKVHIFDIDGAPGEKVQLISKITNTKFIPIQKGEVNFYVDNEKIDTYNLQKNGIVNCTYTIPTSVKDGDILDIKVEYEDKNNIYESSNGYGRIFIKTKDINININTVIGYQNESIGFLIKLQDTETNERVTNGVIELIQNNEVFAKGKVDIDGYCRVCYNPISYLQEDFEKLSNFKFIIEGDNLVMLYPSSVSDEEIYLENEDCTILNEVGIDFFLENDYLFIEELNANYNENIFINNDVLEIVTRINNNINLFKQGLSYYDIHYIPDKIYKEKVIKNKNLYLYDSNLDVDLLEYNLQYRDNQKIICYLSDYNGEEINCNGTINFYIDGELIKNCPVENNKSELILENIKKYTACSHLLQAEYIPSNNEDYTHTITSSYLNIERAYTRIEVEENKFFLNNKANIKVKINTINNFLATGNILFYINNQLINSHYLIENENNECIFVFDFPDDIYEKDYVYTIEYVGNDFIIPSIYSNKIEPKKQNTLLEIENKKATINTLCPIEVKLSTLDYDEINDGNIVIKYNDKEITRNSVLNNKCVLDIYIDDSYDIGEHEFIVEFKDSKNFIQELDVYSFIIEVIEPLDYVYVDNTGKDDNKGTEESPFRTIEQAIQCLSDNGLIYIISLVNLQKNIDINKNIKIVGFNNSIINIKDNIEIKNNKSLSLSNVRFSNNYCEIINNNSLIITHSIIEKKNTISNFGEMKINKNLFYGNINNLINSDVNYNWWGSNKNRYNSEINILLKVDSDKNQNVIGENINFKIYFIGTDDNYYDLPSPLVKCISQNGYFSNEYGYFTNNEFYTTYFDSIKEEDIYIIVDDEKISIKIDSYYKKTEIIAEDIDIPLGYQVPLEVIIQSVGDIFYKFDKNNEIIAQTNNINEGRVVFYIEKSQKYNKLGHTFVKNGIAKLDIFFDIKNFNIDEEYKIKAIYEGTENYFNSESFFNIKIIDHTNVIYVSSKDGLNTNSGEFNSPIQSIQEAVNRNPSIIYLKEGSYLDNGIIANNINLKKFNGKVVFENEKTTLPIFNLKQGYIYGIEFINNECRSIFNVEDSIQIENCSFENNNCSEKIIECFTENTIINMNYCSIINNYNLAPLCNFNFDYNWWGSNNIDFLDDDYTIKNWIIMDIGSEKDYILVDSVTKISSFLLKYRNEYGDYDFENKIPNRISRFYTNVGSLTPIKDYTYHKKANSLFNGLESFDDNNLILLIDDNINFNNQEEIELKCTVTDIYGEPIEGIKVNFEVNELDIKGSGITDNKGVSVFKFFNNNYEIGIYSLICFTSLNKKIGNLIIKKPKIFLNNINFVKIGLDNTLLMFNAVDSIGNKVNIDFDIYIDEEKALNKNIFSIKNGVFSDILYYNVKEANKYKLTLKGSSVNYEDFDEVIDLEIKEEDTYISINPKTLQLGSETILEIKVLNKNNNIIKNIPKLKSNISLFKIEGNEAEIINTNLVLKNGVCVVDIPSINEPGTYNISIHFDGVLGYYKESSLYTSIDVGVNKVKLDSNELQKQLSIKIDENINLDFPVLDINNNPVQSGFFELYVNGIQTKEIINNEVKPIIGYVKNGRGILKYNAKYGDIEKAGIYSFEIKYYDNNNPKQYANTILNTYLTVKQYETYLYIDEIIGKSNSEILIPFDIQSELGDVYKGTLQAIYKDKVLGEVNLKQRNNYILINIPFIEPTEDYITFKYYDDTNELSSIIQNIPFIVTKNNIKMEIVNNKKYAYPNTDEEIQIEVFDESNNRVNYGEIQVYEDNVLKQSSNVFAGLCNFKFNFKKLKTYNLNFIYKFNNYYNSNSYSIDIKTIELPINNISIEEMYNLNGEKLDGLSINTEVLAKINIDSDYEVDDGTIILYLQGNVLGKYNINNINDMVRFKIPQINEGEYNIEIDYIDSDLFEDRKGDNNFKVPIYIEKQKTKLLIDCQTEIEVNKQLDIKAYFDSKDSINGIIKYYISNTIEDKIYKYIGTKQVEDNEAILQYQIPFDISEKFIIKACYIENEQYTESEAEIQCKINKKDTYIIMEDITTFYNDTISINIECDKNLNGELISLYLDDDIHIGTETVIDNYVTFEYNAIEQPGIYILKGIFNGTGVLNNTQNTSILEIKKEKPILCNNNIEEPICNYIDITQNFIDKKGNYIDGDIIYYINKEIIDNPKEFYLNSNEQLNIEVEINPYKNNFYENNIDNLVITPIKNNIIIKVDNIKEEYKRGENIDLDIDLISNCECSIENSPIIYIDDEEVVYTFIDSKINFTIPNHNYKNKYQIKIIIEESEKFNYVEKIFDIKIINTNIVYVDESGDNNNSGTEDSPIKNINKAFDMVNDDGIIYLINGSFLDEEIIVDKNNISIIGNNNTLINCILSINKNIILKDIIFDNSKIINNKELTASSIIFKNDSNIQSKNTLFINNCEFINNKNCIEIYQENKKAIIVDSLFENNNCQKYGACIFSNNGNDIQIKNNIFINNKSLLGGNSICILGNGYISNNIFKNNQNTSEVKLLNGNTILNENVFDTTNICLEINNGEYSANLNYWGVNDNIEEKIELYNDIKNNISSWLVLDYKIKEMNEEEIRIYPLINKIENTMESYSIEDNDIVVQPEVLFSIQNGDLNKTSAIANKEYIIASGINDNTKIIMKLGQEEMEVKK